MSVVLITGAATGIGNPTARTLAAGGHTVYASMRDVAGRNATHAQELLEAGRGAGGFAELLSVKARLEAATDTGT